MFTTFLVLLPAVIARAASIEPRQDRSGCPDLSPCGGQFLEYNNSPYPYECVYVRYGKGPGKDIQRFSCFFDNRGILSGTAARSSDGTCPVQSYLPCRPATTTSTAVSPPPVVTPPVVTPPAEGGRQLHPIQDFGKCLDVRGDTRANGTPVQLYDCNGTPAQSWVWNRANTKIRLAGSNYCLDAGSNISNGVGLKIWTCYDGLDAQAWYATNDNRFAVTGKGQCLDVTGGRFQNSNQVQTWACGTGNKNQAWSA